MKRYFLSLVFFASSSVYPLSYDSGNFGLSSTSVVTISTVNANVVGNVIGNVTGSIVGSTATISSRFVMPSNSAPRTNVTPVGAGQLIFNSSQNELCVSSGSTASTWVKVTSTITACGS